MCFGSSGGVSDHLCIESSRVSSFASQLVDGVDGVLHRERLHSMSELLVSVLVFVCIRRSRVELAPRRTWSNMSQRLCTETKVANRPNPQSS